VKLSVVRECNTQFSVQLARWLVAGSYRILCEVASCTWRWWRSSACVGRKRTLD